MTRKATTRLWAVSLLILGLGGLLLNLNHLFSLHLPDVLLAVDAIACLLALPVMIFSSIWLLKHPVP